MQSLQTWLGGGAPDKEPAAKGASVLSEWNKYSGSGGAATTASPAVTTAELAAAEEGAAAGAASGQRFLSNAISMVSGAASSVAAATSGATSGIPSSQQWTYFAFFLGTGAVFLLMAFFLFLPMIILAPAKFAMTFSIGSALVCASLGALKGWKVMFGHLASKERLPFAGAYFGSLAATLYVSLVMHSYLFSLIFCAAQLITLVYYIASHFPGGTAGAQSVLGFAGRAGMSLGSSAIRATLNSASR
ncbi:Protein transport protein sft2 [Chlorella vulgaris]